MADKKLNEVSQLTDFDYALVVKGNDVAKVTKQQLATILGGLIGTATASKNGLVPYYAGGVLSFQYGVKVSLGSIYRPFTCTI